jgi:hypothetical protein
LAKSENVKETSYKTRKNKLLRLKLGDKKKNETKMTPTDGNTDKFTFDDARKYIQLKKR